MKKKIALAFLPLAFYGCTSQSDKSKADASSEAVDATTEEIAPTLTKVWETDTVMATAESTLYDKSNDIIYVSNINGNHSVKDGTGFIAKMNPDGSIIQLQWATGLNAPKGMALLDDKLYVTDIDELVEIDVANGSITNRYPVQDAAFLNDAATNGENVYFSDSQTGKIHKLEDGKIVTVTEGREGINGLAFDKNGELFILDGQGLVQYDKNSNGVEAINEMVTGGDGLVIIDESTYIASRWKGEIYLIKDGQEYLLLDTTPEASNTADIDYIPAKRLVLVPTFHKNRVVAYTLDY